MYIDGEKSVEALSNNIEDETDISNESLFDDQKGPYVDDYGDHYNCPVNMEFYSSGKKSQWGKKKIVSGKIDKKSQWGKTKVGLNKRSYYKYRNNIF